MNKSFRVNRWLDSRIKQRITNKSNTQGILTIVVQTTLHGIYLIGAIADSNPLINLIFCILLGLSIGQMFVIGHDACHQSLTNNPILNKVIGRFAFYFSLHSYSLWHIEHNIKHHSSTNIMGKDPSWSPKTREEYEQLSLARKTMERIYRSPFGAGPYYIFEMWIKVHSLPVFPDVRAEWHKYLPDSLGIIIGLISQHCLVFLLGEYIAPEKTLTEVWLLGWAIPFLIWNWIMGAVIYSHHTHPSIPWFTSKGSYSFNQVQTCITVHVVLPKLIRLMFFNIMEHTAHHLQVSISMFDLHVAQQQLEKIHEQNIVTYRWSIREYLRITKICKLFDPERRCWTDFSGNPTSPPIPDFIP